METIHLYLRKAQWQLLLRKHIICTLAVKFVISTRNGCPNICCAICLRAWLRGIPKNMPFALLMIWHEQKDHVTDCYYIVRLMCLVSLPKTRSQSNNQIHLQPMRPCHAFYLSCFNHTWCSPYLLLRYKWCMASRHSNFFTEIAFGTVNVVKFLLRVNYKLFLKRLSKIVIIWICHCYDFF